MTKRILLTGGGGFAGAHFFEHVLVETDWDIVLTDSFRHKGKTDRVAEVIKGGGKLWKKKYKERTQVITHDLTVPFSEQAIDAMGKIDYMVAYASESHVDRSISDPVPFIRNNVDLCLSTLELARKLKPKALVWISTDEVAGPVSRDDFDGHPEWSTVLPSNPYAGSKAAQEAFVTSYWRTFGVPAIIVRCMNMIGERQDPEKFVPMTIAKVLRGGTVSIHGTEQEIGTRHYLHSRNLADGILFLLQETHPSCFPAHLDAMCERYPIDGIELSTADRPDMFNIASSDRVDNLAVAKLIAGYVGQDLRYELESFHQARPGHDAHYGLDASKMTALGWTPPISFEDSLKRTVEWTLEHPEWLLAD